MRDIKNQQIKETDPQMTQILELAVKEYKTSITNTSSTAMSWLCPQEELAAPLQGTYSARLFLIPTFSNCSLALAAKAQQWGQFCCDGSKLLHPRSPTLRKYTFYEYNLFPVSEVLYGDR